MSNILMQSSERRKQEIVEEEEEEEVIDTRMQVLKVTVSRDFRPLFCIKQLHLTSELRCKGF
jgi:hypothetical protein